MTAYLRQVGLRSVNDFEPMSQQYNDDKPIVQILYTYRKALV